MYELHMIDKKMATWADKVAHKMRRCNTIRVQLGDMKSPPNEIERPKYMRLLMWAYMQD